MRVGVAVCDPAGVLATPEVTLARDEEAGSDLQALVDLATERDALEVVVGLPRSLSGDEGPAAATARAYAKALAGRVAPRPVRLVDERLTTVNAHRDLRASGVASRRARQVVDQAAAVLILQAALDQERLSGRPPGELVSGRRRARRQDRTKDRHA